MAGKPQTNDLALLWGVGILFGLIVLSKIFDFLNVWIRRSENQLVILFLCVLFLTPLFYWMMRKRASNFKRQVQEKAVIGKAEGSIGSLIVLACDPHNGTLYHNDVCKLPRAIMGN